MASPIKTLPDTLIKQATQSRLTLLARGATSEQPRPGAAGVARLRLKAAHKGIPVGHEEAATKIRKSGRQGERMTKPTTGSAPKWAKGRPAVQKLKSGGSFTWWKGLREKAKTFRQLGVSEKMIKAGSTLKTKVGPVAKKVGLKLPKGPKSILGGFGVPGIIRKMTEKVQTIQSKGRAERARSSGLVPRGGGEA